MQMWLPTAEVMVAKEDVAVEQPLLLPEHWYRTLAWR
jgi:hypothetical protein